MSHDVSACRSCGYDGLISVLSLGKSPLANALLRSDQQAAPEPTYPLDVMFCPRCTLLQLGHTVPPADLFSEYVYFSSYSTTMLAHAADLAAQLTEQRGLSADNLVAEIASNDGYLLQNYLQRGIPVLGIEPAANVARVAIAKRHIPTLVAFFDADLARTLSDEGTRADVIHAHNVLAHVEGINSFVAGIYTLLKDDGLAIIEAPYALDLIDKHEFDTIYHEHVFYYSLTALVALFERHSLTVRDVKHVPLHGGSLQVEVTRQNGNSPSNAVRDMLAQEARWGVRNVEVYQRFARDVEQVKRELVTLLDGLKADGKRIAAYGASAKGTTLLNTCGIGRERIDFVVDRSPHKQGLYTPGTHLPIFSPDKLLADMPDYVVLLTWNFADEIMEQQTEYVQRGGHFIVPVPQPRIV